MVTFCFQPNGYSLERERHLVLIESPPITILCDSSWVLRCTHRKDKGCTVSLIAKAQIRTQFIGIEEPFSGKAFSFAALAAS